MAKILTIDPSGEKGTNGACLVDTETKQVIFYEKFNETFSETIKWLIDLVKETNPEKIVYETTNYIDPENTDRIRMTSLFKVIGAIETFQHYFDSIKSIESVYVRSVKMIKERIYKQELYTSGISYENGRGKGWIFTHAIPNNNEDRDESWLDEKRQRISHHQLDAMIIFKLWTGECKAQKNWESFNYSKSKNSQYFARQNYLAKKKAMVTEAKPV